MNGRRLSHTAGVYQPLMKLMVHGLTTAAVLLGVDYLVCIVNL